MRIGERKEKARKDQESGRERLREWKPESYKGRGREGDRKGKKVRGRGDGRREGEGRMEEWDDEGGETGSKGDRKDYLLILF